MNKNVLMMVEVVSNEKGVEPEIVFEALEAALAELCSRVDLATFEFENVPNAAAEFVAARVPLHPAPRALTAGQDRLSEKALFTSLGIPVPTHAAVDSRADLDRAVAITGLPAVLKTRRMGYDGKGQAVLRSPADLDAAWAALGGQPPNSNLILEAFVPFTREVSCLAVRGQDGQMAFYPLVENVHRAGILRTATPTVNDPLQSAGEDYARRVAEHLGYVGVLAFEFFVANDRLIANEIAPRVHNSGHWTIEGAETSQFENHLRGVLDLPLGDVRLRAPAAAMVNLLGTAPASGRANGFAEALAVPDAHVHLYGKALSEQGRKMGHVTALGQTLADAEKNALTCAERIRFGISS